MRHKLASYDFAVSEACKWASRCGLRRAKHVRKKQLEELGIEEQMKLSALKRAGIFGKPQKTLLEAFFMFIPFLDAG